MRNAVSAEVIMLQDAVWPRYVVRAIFCLLAMSLLTLALSTAPHSQDALGLHGQRHDEFHHWYEQLRQPGSNRSCCNFSDCRPTTARIRSGQQEVLVDGEWTRVPPSAVLKMEAPDLGSHVCAPPSAGSPKAILCVVLGHGV